MRQLTFVKAGQFEWRDVAAPKLMSDTDALVRPVAVARCDVDLYIAAGMTVYPSGAFAFGHECVGEVVDAGPKAGVQPGQRVIVPFQLSCGRCDACKRGYTNTCEAFPFRAAYGLKPLCGTEFGGALSDFMHVPFADHMLVPLPANLDPVAVASAADNVPDGWRAVAPYLKARPGANVLVVGGLAQSVALYAAGAAASLGAGRVLYLDDDPTRRATAEKFGIDVEPLALGERRDKARATRGLAASGATTEQFEITVDGSGNPDALDFVVASTAPNGVCTSVAIYLTPTTPMPLQKMYSKGITFVTGRVHARANMPALIDHCAGGHFHPEHVTSRVVSFAEAVDAMTDSGPKLIFTNDLGS